MAVSAVCRDVAAARALNAAGVAVVLVGTDGAGLGQLASELAAAGRGRVAVFTADPSQASDMAAAAAMAQEQFGGTPVEVSSLAEVAAVVARHRG